MFRSHNSFFTRTVPFAIARAAGEVLKVLDRQPMESRKAPGIQTPVVRRGPPARVHPPYRVLEARRRRARRRAGRH